MSLIRIRHSSDYQFYNFETLFTHSYFFIKFYFIINIYFFLLILSPSFACRNETPKCHNFIVIVLEIYFGKLAISSYNFFVECRLYENASTSLWDLLKAPLHWIFIRYWFGLVAARMVFNVLKFCIAPCRKVDRRFAIYDVVISKLRSFRSRFPMPKRRNKILSRRNYWVSACAHNIRRARFDQLRMPK